jgi:hypothetical protein
MTQRHVEGFLGRIATDPALRRRFGHDRRAAVAAFQEEGHELSAVELAALEALSPEAIERFASALDARIQRADVPSPVEEA